MTAPSTSGHPRSVTVVGASHAAVAVAEALRGDGYRGALRLIGAENHPPYQRPPLSKGYLAGRATGESLALRSPEWYADNGIELLIGRRVIDVGYRDDGSAVVRFTSNGDPSSGTAEFVVADRVVLATGARPRRLSLPNSGADGVMVLRTMDDARALVQRVHAGPVVVIGGGFIGLEAAATVVGLGGRATVLEAGPRILGRAVGDRTARRLHDAHVAAGIDIRVATPPEEILTDSAGRVCAVRAGGRDIAATTVVVGVGVEARTELADALGLARVAGGIVVDGGAVASDGRTVAVGDCTVQPYGWLGPDDARTVRLESVDNTIGQSAAAAASLLGTTPPRRTHPWFWSDQGAQKLQTVGIVGGHDTVVDRIDPTRPGRSVVGYFRDGRLTAAECVNAPGDFLVLRGVLDDGVPLGAAEFADASEPLKRHVSLARTARTSDAVIATHR